MIHVYQYANIIFWKIDFPVTDMYHNVFGRCYGYNVFSCYCSQKSKTLLTWKETKFQDELYNRIDHLLTSSSGEDLYTSRSVNVL